MPNLCVGVIEIRTAVWAFSRWGVFLGAPGGELPWCGGMLQVGSLSIILVSPPWQYYKIISCFNVAFFYCGLSALRGGCDLGFFMPSIC